MTNKRYYYTHNINECLFIKKINEDASVKVLDVDNEDCDEVSLHYNEFYGASGEETARQVEHILNRVNIDASPILVLSAVGEVCEATLDTGATCNVISEEKARSMKARIRPSQQKVRMADGRSSLDVVGETDITLYREKKPFKLSAIVCRQTDTEILAGMPFLKQNDIAIRPYSNEIIINNQERVKYSSKKSSSSIQTVRLTIHSDKYQVVLPGESALYQVKGVDGEVAVEPRWDNYNNRKSQSESMVWPKPQILPVVDGRVSLQNTTSEPVVVRKSEHICNVYPEVHLPISTPGNVIPPASVNSLPHTSPPTSVDNHKDTPVTPVINTPQKHKTSNYSNSVTINPDKLLSKEEEESFRQLMITYDEVFRPEIGRYNEHSGKCFVEVNMGQNLPDQHKGRVPFYGKSDLVELQEKFDKLESQKIMSRPQDIGVCVENTNPSFLVRKQPPSTDKRLVTDFGSIAHCCRPTPSKLPNVESTLLMISTWKYIAKTDLSSSYHQLELKHDSKKYCGVHTPFKGLLVYNTGCMGLPGVEVALEELTCLLFGDMVKEGKVAKLSDDLFIGGNSAEELEENIHCVLNKLAENNITINASKTVIAPKTMTILGWVWTSGQLKASPHKLSALSTCEKPETIASLKSYVGAYRFLSRVIKDHGKLLSPLENMMKGKNSKDKIEWTDYLSDAFKKSQDALLSAKNITIPRPSDRLCIITDASAYPGGIGATLYAIRGGKPHLAGFYNTKLPEFQSRWLPCELEAVAIAAAINHFSPLIIQSELKPQILTDSKPCCDAAEKLKRGEFSASARLSSFLSTVNRYQAEISHIAGAANLPADFESRHPNQCENPSCSICKFVKESIESVVQSITVEEILKGEAKMPYTNRAAWKSVQEEDSDLRKVKSFKIKRTEPRKKSKNLSEVRKYLKDGVRIARDGVLVHPTASPLGPIIEQIVIPQHILRGFLTALHLQLKHPSANQLSKAFTRHFYAKKIDNTVAEISRSCDVCASLKDIPKAMIEQSTDSPPATVGGNFAADVVRRCLQKILIVRETVTGYTSAELIPDETVPTISQSLVQMCNLLRPSPASKILIRLDPAPAHQSIFINLQNDASLLKENINVVLGRTLNKNKNPVVDKAIRELHRELLIINPTGGPVSQSQLSEAIASLNCRYRNAGMSAHELWTQRDHVTGDQLPINDRDLILNQHYSRIKNHPHSEKSKAPGKSFRPVPDISIGSLVYVYQDRDKEHVRPRYLVTSLNDEWITLRRFTKTLFGVKEYKARINEVYKVPSFDSVNLPEAPEDSSEDDDDDFSVPATRRERKQDHNVKAHPEEDPPEDSDLSESAESDNNLEDSSSEMEDQNSPRLKRKTSKYSLDPPYTPPAQVSPSSMKRTPRTVKKPDRYGSWVT